MILLNKKAVTLLELIISVLLTTVVLSAAYALYNGAQRLYFDGRDKVTISYELQYALDHVYKNVIQAIGDESNPTASHAIEVPDSETLYVYINNNDPLSAGNYASRTTYIYSKVGDVFNFNNGSANESLVPKVTVTDVSFLIDGNILTVSISATHGTVTDAITLYSSCYPRLASFR